MIIDPELPVTDHVSFRERIALGLPVSEESFDLGMSEHVQMNVAEIATHHDP